MKCQAKVPVLTGLKLLQKPDLLHFWKACYKQEW